MSTDVTAYAHTQGALKACARARVIGLSPLALALETQEVVTTLSEVSRLPAEGTSCQR